MFDIISQFRMQDPSLFIWTVIFSFVLGLSLYNLDFFILIVLKAYRSAFYGGDRFSHGKPGSCLSGLVIIPSLLRDDDDLKEIIATVDSCGKNDYPNDLFIIVSVDGKSESPATYQKLESWIKKQNYPQNVRVYLTYREIRGGKIMAMDMAVKYMQMLVETGIYPIFPKIYFSVDADSTLGEHALERLVVRLMKRHPLTGNPVRAVAGLCINPPEWFWRGWRQFFTVQGQNYLNVAREFIVYGAHRYNWNIVPLIALPGPLYATWSEMLVQAPKYMGFVRSIRWTDYIKWWFGFGAPKFSEYQGEAIPAAISGGLTDDTTIAVISGIAHWKNGNLSFDAPKTPLHAFGRMLWNWWIERPHNCDNNAKVYTFSPPTLKGLWNQRVRWNSCRVEVGERFFMSFLFHWDISSAFTMMFVQRSYSIFECLFYYIIIPFVILNGQSLSYAFVIGSVLNFLSNTLYTIFALILESDRKKFWRIIFALPTRGLYALVFSYCTTAWGLANDILGNGLNAKFVPEKTLIASKSQRIALWYRFRRFISLCYRSIRHGDVPLGTFWWGFREHEPYVESAFQGWTSGKKAKYSLR